MKGDKVMSILSQGAKYRPVFVKGILWKPMISSLSPGQQIGVAVKEVNYILICFRIAFKYMDKVVAKSVYMKK